MNGSDNFQIVRISRFNLQPIKLLTMRTKNTALLLHDIYPRRIEGNAS